MCPGEKNGGDKILTAMRLPTIAKRPASKHKYTHQKTNSDDVVLLMQHCIYYHYLEPEAMFWSCLQVELECRQPSSSPPNHSAAAWLPSVILLLSWSCSRGLSVSCSAFKESLINQFKKWACCMVHVNVLSPLIAMSPLNWQLRRSVGRPNGRRLLFWTFSLNCWYKLI